jgi:biotin carboxyl carrier protein
MSTQKQKGPQPKGSPQGIFAMQQELDQLMTLSRPRGWLGLAPEAGRVAKVLVGPGQEVTAGQELMSLGQLELHGRLERLQDRLVQSERLLKASPHQEVGPPEFLAGLKRSIREDRRELEAMQFRLLRGAKVQAAQVGTVAEVFASPGQMVKEGQPLVSLSPRPKV